MKTILRTVALLALAAAPAWGQVQKFPYEASIGGDDVYVRSGPGKKYYPTGKLRTGDRVIVHRHDPGGWYMIGPPAGSFSFVRSDALKPLGNRRALVVGNNVPVLIGSALGDSRDIEQVRLSTNDQVQLVDEQLVAGAGGTALYRIVPPRGEYRWVLGQFVTPVDDLVRRQHDRDPFSTPSHAKPAPSTEQAPKPIASAKESAAGPVVDESATGFGTGTTVAAKPAAPPDAVHRHVPEVEHLAREKELLAEVDRQFREMTQADMSAWHLAPIEQSYRSLKQSATSPAIASRIDLRLKAVEKYRGLKAEYDDFIRLTGETTRRDAELVALQQGTPSASMASESPPVSTVVTSRPTGDFPSPRATQPPSDRLAANPGTIVTDSPQAAITGPATLLAPNASIPAPTSPAESNPPAVDFLPPIVGQPSQGGIPQPEAAAPRFEESSGPMLNAPTSSTTVASPAASSPAPAFIGAGLVQKAKPIGPGFPQHVLITPRGQVLAFLTPGPGVNLDQYVGQSVGVQGERTRRPDLRGELINVHGLTPVRLTAQ